MKRWSTAALAMLLFCGSAHADVLQAAFDAVDTMLKRDGGSLVPYQASCHRPLDPDDPRLFVSASTVVFVNRTDQAVLVNTGMCNGGNGSGQYFVVIQNGKAKVITNIGIQDMNFLAQNMYADGNSIFMYGSRWLPKDPHCCPSRKATLEYNIKTEEHRLMLAPRQ